MATSTPGEVVEVVEPLGLVETILATATTFSLILFIPIIVKRSVQSSRALQALDSYLASKKPEPQHSLNGQEHDDSEIHHTSDLAKIGGVKLRLMALGQWIIEMTVYFVAAVSLLALRKQGLPAYIKDMRRCGPNTLLALFTSVTFDTLLGFFLSSPTDRFVFRPPKSLGKRVPAVVVITSLTYPIPSLGSLLYFAAKLALFYLSLAVAINSSNPLLPLPLLFLALFLTQQIPETKGKTKSFKVYLLTECSLNLVFAVWIMLNEPFVEQDIIRSMPRDQAETPLWEAVAALFYFFRPTIPCICISALTTLTLLEWAYRYDSHVQHATLLSEEEIESVQERLAVERRSICDQMYRRTRDRKRPVVRICGMARWAAEKLYRADKGMTVFVPLSFIPKPTRILKTPVFSSALLTFVTIHVVHAAVVLLVRQMSFREGGISNLARKFVLYSSPLLYSIVLIPPVMILTARYASYGGAKVKEVDLLSYSEPAATSKDGDVETGTLIDVETTPSPSNEPGSGEKEVDGLLSTTPTSR
ncbi:hypothetical protein IE53DRAFT_378917 [Violaceomyces palustris]|uniref:Uncharacterized protein n=1 Tax=Violaceomyces palustris TaxID=1673888 RepID=A0ACD0P084_9BASI|nr:hypothetical protein IE53DRAFT_378917 [Violaceomyces palustris]